MFLIPRHDFSGPYQGQNQGPYQGQNQDRKFVQLVDSPVDTVRNPYAPPLRHGCETEYAQLGYLSEGRTKLLLFGKRATHRDKWYYHTVVDGIKLPVEHNRRQCTVAPGCDRLADRDQVTVDGRPYTVHIYESDQYAYDPFV